MERLSRIEARRIALAAQGFAAPRPRRPDLRHLRAVARRLDLIQLDFVNVLVPAHYLVPFSRLGSYDRSLLDDLVYRRREMAEQWAHEASLVSVEAWPLLRARLGDRRGRALERFAAQHRDYVATVLAEVRARGPVAADELRAPPDQPPRDRRSWAWTWQRAALECHFSTGAIAIDRRRPDMARVYDLAERIVGAHHARAVAPDAALAELARRAARALGVATAADLADYYRLPVKAIRAALPDLGLTEVRVDGWKDPAYLDPAAAQPRAIDAAALLSPFDPLIWFRPRTHRLWDFHYRIEIYTPPSQRQYGYYVLPFLLGDQLVARVDLKADRAGRRLLVPAAHLEPGARAGAVVAPLAAELAHLARWLDLDEVVVGRKGSLARPLTSRLARTRRPSPRAAGRRAAARRAPA